MSDRIKTDDVIVVEGKYDRIKVAEAVDGIIIETDGFAVFSEKQLRETLRKLSETRKIIILTDSDAAGFKIRSYIASFLPADRVRHALIPDIGGKERRKPTPSKEGKLGVEGMTADVIREALIRCGIEAAETREEKDTLTTYDLFELGLSGTAGSAERRRRLLEKLSLPKRTGTSLMLSVINATMTREAFLSAVTELDKEVT